MPHRRNMKKREIIFVLVALICVFGDVVAQPRTSEFYYRLYSQSETASEFNRFISKLEGKKSKLSDDEFLKHIFSKTHKKFLKLYEGNADFQHLSENGRYNCLTGTALYAIILTHFKYEFKIIETNYHIFLVVNLKSGKVLFEATDPIHGYLTDAKAIQKRVSRYRENRPVSNDVSGNYSRYTFSLFNEVDLNEMAGLLHYNEAVEAFNAHQVAVAIQHLDKATKSYNSPRIEEFTKLVLIAVENSKMDLNVKEIYVKKIQSIRRQKVPGISTTVTD
jgi:hypothetical protein